jgi:hypothetical protein
MLVLYGAGILLTWAAIALTCIGIGSIVLTRFSKDYSVRDAFWMGLAVSVAFVEAWNLLLPITSWTTVLLLCTGILGLLANHAVLFSHIKFTLQDSRGLFFLGLAFAFFLAVRSCGPCQYYDTGLYGAGAIRWSQTYPAVPGLANLHGRFGFNSSALLCIAAVGQGVWKDLGFHLFTGFLLSALWTTLLPACARCVRGTAASPADWFHCIIVLPAFFWTTRSRIVGTLTDEPAAIVCFIAAGMLFQELCHTHDEDEQPTHPPRLVLAATLFSLGVAFKASTAVFALLAWCLVFRGIWQASAAPEKRRLHLGAALLFSTLLLLPWLARAILLSGYPFYPATILGFPVDWKLPLSVAQHYSIGIQSWGRGQDSSFIDTRGLNWVGAWLHSAVRNRVAFQVPMAISLAGLAVGLTLRFRGKSRPSCPWLALLFPSVAGILFWFVASPDLRFAQFAIWTAAATLGTWGIVVLDTPGRRWHAQVLAALVLCLTWCLISLGWREPIEALRGVRQPQPLLKVNLIVRHTRSGLAVYVPAQGNQCWDALLPCTPYFDETLRLRKGPSMRAGFTSELNAEDLRRSAPPPAP